MSVPATLLTWFMEMFRYAEQSQVARKVVTKLLGPDGPFQNAEFIKSKLGGDFFLTLTDASPAEARWDVCSEQSEAGRMSSCSNWMKGGVALWPGFFGVRIAISGKR